MARRPRHQIETVGWSIDQDLCWAADQEQAAAELNGERLPDWTLMGRWQLADDIRDGVDKERHYFSRDHAAIVFWNVHEGGRSGPRHGWVSSIRRVEGTPSILAARSLGGGIIGDLQRLDGQDWHEPTHQWLAASAVIGYRPISATTIDTQEIIWVSAVPNTIEQGASTVDQARERLTAFVEGVSQLPAADGVLCMRGCAPDAEFTTAGRLVITQEITATTRNLAVATENDTISDLYAIISRTGRDISAFSANKSEGEVVFLPGTAFALVQTRTINERTVHIVIEVEPEHPVIGDGIADQIGDLMTQVLNNTDLTALPPATAPIGKFAGDLG